MWLRHFQLDVIYLDWAPFRTGDSFRAEVAGYGFEGGLVTVLGRVAAFLCYNGSGNWLKEFL